MLNVSTVGIVYHLTEPLGNNLFKNDLKVIVIDQIKLIIKRVGMIEDEVKIWKTK